MSENVRLPDLQQAALDSATLEALFSDLASCAKVLSVVMKGGPGRVDKKGVSLAEGRDALLSGSVRGIQIRYLHEGREWCDTLMATPAGIRVVRVCTDDVLASGSS